MDYILRAIFAIALINAVILPFVAYLLDECSNLRTETVDKLVYPFGGAIIIVIWMAASHYVIYGCL